jgi:iron complex outermembrane receptor protein
VRQIQSSVDIANRQEPVGDYFRHAFDVDSQYHTAPGGRQDAVAGAGYRFVGEGFAGRNGYSLTPAIDESSLLTAFVQDEIALLGGRLAVTVGSQVQYDSFSGAGVQPTVRAMWKGLPRQRLSARLSRALRTPSLYERGIRIELLPVPTDSGLPLDGVAVGNPAIQAETLFDTEAGYRLEIGTAASIDVTGFVGHYRRLRTQEPASPIVQLAPLPHLLLISQFGDQLEVTTRGFEATGHWAQIPSWRFDGSYARFRLIPLLSASSQDPAAATEDGSAPRLQWQLRSTFSPGSHTTVSAAIFHVGPLALFQVPAYSRLDVNLEWRLNARLSAMVIGQNLLEATHSEFSGADSLLLATRLPRSVGLRLRWAC